MTSSKSGSSIRVATGKASGICRPFTIEFRLSAPEAGYKILVAVEKSCSKIAEPIWKLAFDLFRKIEKEYVEIVHVSFTAETAVEAKGVEKIAADGVPRESARVLKKEVYPVAKLLEGQTPTAGQKAALKKSMSKAAVVAVDL